MATTNTLGTLAATGVLHTALGITLKRLPFLGRLASDIAPSMADKLMPFNVAQILKNYNAGMTVYDRSATGSYAVQDGGGLAIPADGSFTLNKWPAVSLKLSATEVNQIVDTYTNVDARAVVIQKLMDRAFNAFATNIVTDFLSVITAGSFAQNYVSAVGTMDNMHLGAAVDVLLQNDALGMKTPDAILNIAAYRELANSLTPIPNYSGVTEVVESGAINLPVAGCASVTRYNLNMPADAPRGIVFDPQAIVFACRPPLEEIVVNSPLLYTEVITDAATGFSVLYREAKNQDSGEVTRTITTMYGFAKGLSNHLVRVIPAAE